MTGVTAVELNHGNADELRALYDEYEWWADREYAYVERALEHTSLAIGLRDGGELVAAARVFTDFVYYAKIYDVIVAEARRGNGFGERLMETVIEHPDPDDINLQLDCREGLVEFYEQCEFEEHDMTTEIAGSEEGFIPMVHWREDERS
jgi:predicted GNAT family N-acyltransferase